MINGFVWNIRGQWGKNEKMYKRVKESDVVISGNKE